MNGENPARFLFISHRHKDKAVADVFREAFEDWSNGEVRVFQSSNATTAPRVGDELDDAIRQAVGDAHVLLLIYTEPDQDWAWCMYECGLAQDPASMDTRVVVFHITPEAPGPLEHLVGVPMEPESLRALAEGFHRDAEFFPRFDRAVAPGVSEEKITERAEELYAALLHVLPRSPAQDLPRQDLLTLSLDLRHEDEVRRAAGGKLREETLASCRKLLEEHCVIARVAGQPLEHFGLDALLGRPKLAELVASWRSASEHPDLNWDRALYDEITRAVLNRSEQPLAVPFDSVDPDSNAWFLPVLSRFRVVPELKALEFDVLLCGIEPGVAQRMIARD